MKIVTFKVNAAVADHHTKESVADAIGKMFANPSAGMYGVEILDPNPDPSPVFDAEPRKKRKYTRRAKKEAEDVQETVKDGIKVRRVRMKDGVTVESRGNCVGGGSPAGQEA